MKTSFLQTIITIISAMLLTSCVRDVVLDAGEKPKVVVECVLSDNDVQELRLNFTKGAVETEVRTVTEAVVTLTDLTSDIMVGIFEKIEEDIWTLDYTAIPGHRYGLEVEIPGYDRIYAEDVMPDADIKATWCLPGQHQFGSDFNYAELYHSWNFVMYHLKSMPNTIYVSGMNYNKEKGLYEVAENICTDFPYTDKFNLTGEVYAPQIDTVFRWGYEYHESVYPALIGSRLHRRYLRISAHSDVSRDWLIVSGSFEGEYQYELNLSPIGLENDGKILELEEGKGYVSFISVSDNYDKYLEGAIYFQQLQESTDMTSVYLRNNVYTNINGGLGIFAAAKEVKMQWANVKTPDFSDQYDDK